MEEKINLIKSIGEEIIGGENLERLLTHKKNVVAYDGFEPSGRMHIAQGLLRAHNVNKFIKAGIKFKFWVADWFALMNLKMGGDLSKIQKAGQVMIKTWAACGMDVNALDEEGNPMIEFIWSSEEINKRSDEYWKLVLDIGTRFGLNRIKKCTMIMGRKEEENNNEMILKLNSMLDSLFLLNDMDEIQKKQIDIKNIMNQLIEKDTTTTDLAASQIFYPVMQCADVFFLGVDITSLGMDQRKCNMLVLEYCDKIKRKNKPIIISHHMVMGLDGSDKMSKSNPDNTIFMDDTPAEVKRKINMAFCEEGNIVVNPLLDWIKHIILPINMTFVISKDEKWNEMEMIYSDYKQLETDFEAKKIHPKRLKLAMITHLNNMLQPIQKIMKT